MILRNVLTVLGSAAATAALTLTLAVPRVESVAEAGPAIKPVIARPQLTSQRCTFVLKTDKETYEAGESPVVEVTASNLTERRVQATVWVSLSATAPLSRLSRTLAMPRPLWTQDLAFDLGPGETKSMRATCKTPLPAGQDVRIVLSDKKDAVLATSVGVPASGGPNNQGRAAPPTAAKP